jgi:hypothetical protein
MAFSTSNFTMELKDIYHDGNKERSFVTLPPEIELSEKQGCVNQIPFDTAISRH